MSLRRAPRMSRVRLAFVGAAAALCLSACILGGTGSDHENGITGNPVNTDGPDKVKISDPNALAGISARVTDSAGRPLSGVSLAFFDPAYRPDLGQPPEAVVSGEPESLVSDSGGYVRLSLKAAGKFVVEGVSQGKTLFFDTLAVADLKQSAIYTFRARAARAFRGKVKLASGLSIDSGRVFIRGTGRMAKVDSAGGYDLGMLPADAERMALGLRFVASPVAVLRVAPSPSSVADSAVKPAYACKVLPGDSAAKAVTPQVMGTEPASRLDTAQIDPALKACGALAQGSVIQVTTSRSPATAGAYSTETGLLVLKGADSTSYTSPKVLGPVVVPLAQCVPDLGKESTTFAVDVQAGASSGDLVVNDLSETCPAH